MGKKRQETSLPLWIGLAVVISIFLYPTWTNTLNNVLQIQTINRYTQTVLGISEERKQELFDAADAYNEKIYQQQQKKLFMYQGEKATDAEYESVLRVTDNTVMAYVEVPGKDIYLPIAHGTKSEELTYEAGHVYGSSVPVGGANTHSIIAGHTGLKNADIFNDLRFVEAGDQFYIHVLDRTLVYQVDQLTVVYPDDEDAYLQIEDGKDLVTLYTCTPYGINDRRLLVRGVYTGDLDTGDDSNSLVVKRHNRDAIIKLILLTMIPIGIIIVGIQKERRHKEKGGR